MRASSQVKVVASKIRCLRVCREVFLDRIQTQEEIHRLIEEVFGAERKKLSLEEFTQIIEEVSSEMFLAVKILIKYSYIIDHRALAVIPPMQ